LTLLADDGIVVVKVGHERGAVGRSPKMVFARSAVLREKFGTDTLIEFDKALDDAGTLWREQVLETAAERFERRLTEESSSLRLEIADVRLEIATARLSVLRWMAGLLIAHAGVIIATVFAMMSFLVNALKPGASP
jgi:hypothetical protein